MHLLHVGYVGLAGNVHYDAVANFVTGWFGIHLLGGACAPEDRREVAAVAAAAEEPAPAPAVRPVEPVTAHAVASDAPRSGRTRDGRSAGVTIVDRAAD